EPASRELARHGRSRGARSRSRRRASPRARADRADPGDEGEYRALAVPDEPPRPALRRARVPPVLRRSRARRIAAAALGSREARGLATLSDPPGVGGDPPRADPLAKGQGRVLPRLLAPHPSRHGRGARARSRALAPADRRGAPRSPRDRKHGGGGGARDSSPALERRARRGETPSSRAHRGGVPGVVRREATGRQGGHICARDFRKMSRGRCSSCVAMKSQDALPKKNPASASAPTPPIVWLTSSVSRSGVAHASLALSWRSRSFMVISSAKSPNRGRE